MQKNRSKVLAVIGIAAILVVLLSWNNLTVLWHRLWDASAPVLLGIVIAYILNILMSFYQRHIWKKAKSQTGKRVICMLLSFATLIVMIGLVIVLIVPELVKCLQQFVASIQPAYERAVGFVNRNEQLRAFLESIGVSQEGIAERIPEITDMLVMGINQFFTSAFSIITSVFSVLVTFLIAVIFSIYILMGKEKIKNQFKSVLKAYVPKYEDKILYVVHVFDHSFHNFIVGQCTEAVILGSLCIVGMLILQLPYAVMIGTFIGFTALIPIAGAYIGAIVGAFMIATISPVKAVVFIIFIVVLQQLEGNLIYPRVVGKSIGLPGIWVLMAVTLGGGVLGIGGMLFFVPVTSAFYRMLKEDVIRKTN